MKFRAFVSSVRRAHRAVGILYHFSRLVSGFEFTALSNAMNGSFIASHTGLNRARILFVAARKEFFICNILLLKQSFQVLAHVPRQLILSFRRDHDIPLARLSAGMHHAPCDHWRFTRRAASRADDARARL